MKRYFLFLLLAVLLCYSNPSQAEQASLQYLEPCAKDADCDDQNACTQEYCSLSLEAGTGYCIHSLAETGCGNSLQFHPSENIPPQTSSETLPPPPPEASTQTEPPPGDPQEAPSTNPPSFKPEIPPSPVTPAVSASPTAGSEVIFGGGCSLHTFASPFSLSFGWLSFSFLWISLRMKKR